MLDLPIFYSPNIKEDNSLPEQEAQHCLRVLRLGQGDEILTTDGKGYFYHCKISEASKKHCTLKILQEIHWQKNWHKHLTLCVVPTKSIDRLEWLIEKAVEMGVDRIICIKTKHAERKHLKAERLEKIILSAMKQSQKALYPELLVGLSFGEALTLCKNGSIYLAHCREASESLQERQLLPKHYDTQAEAQAVFIGPEGDFTVEEIIQAQEVGAKMISLGESRLRTETAGFVALNQLHFMEMLAE